MNVTTHLLKLILGGIFTSIATLSVAAWPERTITMIVPFPAGGNVDAYARQFAPALSRVLGQPVVVDNRGGASGRIGLDAVGRSKPDGYTIMLGNVTSTVGLAVLEEPKVDPLTLVAPICTLLDLNVVLLVNSKLGVHSLEELKKLSEQTPLNYGSSGASSIARLAMVQLLRKTGIKATHVPYKGGAPHMVDLLGGQVQMGMHDVPNSAPHIKSGALTPLLIVGVSRLPEFPAVPTTSELGINKPNFTSWNALFVPKDMPADIKQKLERAALEAFKDPVVQKFSSQSGNRAVYRNSKEASELMKDGMHEWGNFVSSISSNE